MAKTNLESLRDRLVDTQRALVLAAADAGILPSDNALRKIADLEVAIGAVEHMSEVAELKAGKRNHDAKA